MGMPKNSHLGEFLLARQLGSKYILQESIGRGAMGEVFRGHDDAGKELAFKLLHPDMAGDPQVVARFVQERSILLSVSGPNLVRVVDLVVEGQTLAIAMELVEGADLRAHLNRYGTLTPAQVCHIGAGIANGLAIVHEANIIHRDIKPENILISTVDGVLVPKVTDFGVSSLVDAERARSTMLVGTPQYIAPEASEGGTITAASDLYALGIVLYELASGITPFAGGSVMAVLRRHSSVSPGRPAGIPDELWDLISWLLAKNPAQRPPSARQVATILDALAPSLQSYPPAPRLTEPPAPLPSLETQATQAVAFPLGIPTGGTDDLTSLPQAGMNTSGPQQSMSFPPAPPAVAFSAPRSPEPSAAGKKSGKGKWTLLLSLLAVLLLGGGSLVAVNLLGADKGSNEAKVLPADPSTAAPSADNAPEATQDVTPEVSAEASGEATPALDDLPDYTGKTVSEAQQAIATLTTAEGERVTTLIVDKYDTSVPDGTVLSQIPEAGWFTPSEVELTVARSAVISYLDDLKPVAGGWSDSGAVLISGQSYPHAVASRVCSGSSGATVEYNLGRNYESFTATAGIVDDASDSAAVVLLEVFADGRQVSTQTITYGKPFAVTADMSGVLRMKIQWQETTCAKDDYSGSTELALGDAKLQGIPGKVPVESPAP